jgi:hypothetical protein
MKIKKVQKKKSQENFGYTDRKMGKWVRKNPLVNVHLHFHWKIYNEIVHVANFNSEIQILNPKNPKSN